MTAPMTKESQKLTKWIVRREEEPIKSWVANTDSFTVFCTMLEALAHANGQIQDTDVTWIAQSYGAID